MASAGRVILAKFRNAAWRYLPRNPRGRARPRTKRQQTLAGGGNGEALPTRLSGYQRAASSSSPQATPLALNTLTTSLTKFTTSVRSLAGRS